MYYNRSSRSPGDRSQQVKVEGKNQITAVDRDLRSTAVGVILIFSYSRV
ncbi:MAG: hypothetical protein AB4290_17300 [Spirulina sp.]